MCAFLEAVQSFIKNFWVLSQLNQSNAFFCSSFLTWIKLNSYQSVFYQNFWVISQLNQRNTFFNSFFLTLIELNSSLKLVWLLKSTTQPSIKSSVQIASWINIPRFHDDSFCDSGNNNHDSNYHNSSERNNVLIKTIYLGYF